MALASNKIVRLDPNTVGILYATPYFASHSSYRAQDVSIVKCLVTPKIQLGEGGPRSFVALDFERSALNAR